MSLLRVCLEGAGLAGLVAAACFLVPRMKASHRAMLWWLVAAKLLVGLLPLRAIEVAALPAPAAVPAAAVAAVLGPIQVLREAVPAPPSTIDVAWGMWIWIGGCAVLFACAVPGWLQARDWRRAGRPVSDPGVALSVSRAARIVGLSREPRVLAVAGLPGPLVTGLVSPCVLLPAETLSRFHPEELEMTLAHEMAHIARGDLWWGLVPALARRIFFFHPAAWIAEREYAVAREAACDEAVLRPGADAFVYGQLLLRFASRAPSSASIPMSRHRMLRRRLEMIESIVRRVPLSRAGWVLVGLATLAMIPVRLVANEVRAGETPCLDIGNNDETAYVITNGKTHAMCGDVSDVRDAEAARGNGGDVIWFRVGSQQWVIRDPETVAEGRRYFRAITEIGQRQSEIGIEQSKVGQEQSRIGMEQSKIGMEQAEQARRELQETMRKAELDAARQHEQGLEQELQAEQAAREKASADVERDRERLAEQMRVFSQRMEELGERQGAFGEKQRELGAKMEREMTETQRALSEFLERSIKDGRATRTP